MIEPRGAGSPLDERQLISASLTLFYVAKMITAISFSFKVCIFCSDTYNLHVRLLLIGLFKVEALLVPVFYHPKSRLDVSLHEAKYLPFNVLFEKCCIFS